MSFVAKYFDGVKIFFTGWNLFWSNKPLRKLALAPLILTIIVLILGITFGWQLVPAAMELVTPILGNAFSGFLLFLVTAIFHLLYIISLVVFLFLFGNLVSIPFNALIAERSLKIKGASYYEPKGKADWLKFNTQMLIAGLIKTFIVLCLGVLMFILSFVPILSMVVTFFSIFVLAFDTCDYALELKNQKLKDRWEFVKTYFWELCGYTTVLSVTFFIPGLNIFLLPVFITAGSIFVSERLQ